MEDRIEISSCLSVWLGELLVASTTNIASFFVASHTSNLIAAPLGHIKRKLKTTEVRISKQLMKLIEVTSVKTQCVTA